MKPDPGTEEAGKQGCKCKPEKYQPSPMKKGGQGYEDKTIPCCS